MRPKQISISVLRERKQKTKSLPGTCWTHVLSIIGHSRRLTYSGIYHTLLKACILRGLALPPWLSASLGRGSG